MACDTLGRPVRFILTVGQRHDSIPAKDLLDGFKAKAVLADKAYDNNDLRQFIAEMNAEAAISRLLRPFSNFNRSSSRMRRIDNLSVGIGSPRSINRGSP